MIPAPGHEVLQYDALILSEKRLLVGIGGRDVGDVTARHAMGGGAGPPMIVAGMELRPGKDDEVQIWLGKG